MTRWLMTDWDWTREFSGFKQSSPQLGRSRDTWANAITQSCQWKRSVVQETGPHSPICLANICFRPAVCAFLLGSGKWRVTSSFPLKTSPCSDFVLNRSLAWTSVTTSYSHCLFFLMRLYRRHNLDQVPNFCYWNNAAVKQWTFPVPLNHTQFCSQRNSLRCQSDCITETCYLPSPSWGLTFLNAFPD